jgi:hypothetical protein
MVEDYLFVRYVTVVRKKVLIDIGNGLNLRYVLNLIFLQPVHDDAHIRNLKIIKKKGKTDCIKGKRN